MVNKEYLVEKYAEQKGISKKEAKERIHDVIEVIMETIAEGEKLSIYGFLNFEIVDTVARKGVNPQTGEPIVIKASKKVKITQTRAFKNLAL